MGVGLEMLVDCWPVSTLTAISRIQGAHGELVLSQTIDVIPEAANPGHPQTALVPDPRKLSSASCTRTVLLLQHHITTLFHLSPFGNWISYLAVGVGSEPCPQTLKWKLSRSLRVRGAPSFDALGSAVTCHSI